MSPLIQSYRPRQFEIPPDDVYGADVIRVEDLGEVKGFDGESKRKVKLIWKLDATNSRGCPYEIHQTLNASLHPKSALYKVICDILGHPPAPGSPFELEDLVGVKVRIAVKQNSTDDGRTYANISAIMRPLTKREREEEQRVQRMTAQVLEQAAPAPKTSTRVEAFTVSPPPAEESEAISDEDIPF